MRNLFLIAAITAAFLHTSAEAETINCTEITSVPTIITVQGIYCLKSDKSSSLTSGNIIDIQANNVTIDLNGFKLGGLGGGTGTTAVGISADGRQNITIRNGSIRGFSSGIALAGNSSGGLIENVLFDTIKQTGIRVEGTGHLIRNNRVVNTGPVDQINRSFGLFVGASNTVVADNIISGTSENGIIVSMATLVELRNNSILDTKSVGSLAGTPVAIGEGTGITVIDNRILNVAGTGSEGISVASSNGVNCIGNTVAGFVTALSGCDFESGNITP
jgi:hypothetical protein